MKVGLVPSLIMRRISLCVTLIDEYFELFELHVREPLYIHKVLNSISFSCSLSLSIYLSICISFSLQEYQLVQGVDLRPYRNYIMQNYNLATNSSNGLQNGELFFVLSMGS